MKRQHYRCPACRLASSVPYRQGEGVFAVLYRLRLDHAARSAACTAPERHLRLLENKPGVPGAETESANDFQAADTSGRPPFFVRDSLSETGKTIQLVDEDGHMHAFHVDEALALIEARLYAERYGEMFINTAEFADISSAEAATANAL